jgi:RHS repeat-associated protein
MDHLGSTRLVTDGSGNVVARYDYLPFGEEIPADTARTTALGYKASSDGFNPKFTGQIRDTETGFDFFNVRYYSSSQGRFVGADPGNAGTDLSVPQSVNGYSYVLNNPLARIDPLGLDSFSINDAASTGSVTFSNWQITLGFGGAPTYSAPNAFSFYGGLGSFAKGVGQEAIVNSVIDIANTIDTMRQASFGGPGLRMARVQPANSAQRYGMYFGMVAPFLIPGVGEEEAGARVLGVAGFSSKTVAKAAKALEAGRVGVEVGSRSEAEELFFRLYQGEGYRNTTGFVDVTQEGAHSELKNFFGSKKGTYHWDTGAGHGLTNPHGTLPHIQIHTFRGPVIRIFYR